MINKTMMMINSADKSPNIAIHFLIRSRVFASICFMRFQIVPPAMQTIG